MPEFGEKKLLTLLKTLISKKVCHFEQQNKFHIIRIKWLKFIILAEINQIFLELKCNEPFSLPEEVGYVVLKETSFFGRVGIMMMTYRSPKINSMNAVGQIPAELGPSDKLVLNREETDFGSEDLTRTREGIWVIH